MASERNFLYKDVLPFMIMVAMECTNVGLNTLFKAATQRGMSFFVFVVYSYAIAALLLLPSPFIYRWATEIPPLSPRIIGKEFFLGIIGSISILCGYKGIENSSPTLASAMSTLVPAVTFILAIILRMEKLVWRSSSSQAKVLGTVASIAGALIVILYKGPSITIFSPQNPSNGDGNFLYSSNSKWITGGFLLAIENVITSMWYIVQAQILKEYPAKLVIIFFYNLFATIISGAISFVAEHERGAWKLKLDISLSAIVFSGLFGFLCGFIYIWILELKGPVYIAMFKPLSIAIATVMGIIFLGDTLHIGSIIGAIVISLGFYAVMWGKATEEINEDFAFASELESSSERIPLLTNSKVDNA